MMDAVYCVTLPFPPSVNNLFSQGMVNGRMRRFPSKQYKAWRKAAWAHIKQARIPRIEGKVAIRISLTPPNAARRDVDNYNKGILDALVDAGVLDDDSQVDKLLSVWDHDCLDPCAFVEIGSAHKDVAPITPDERRELRKFRDLGAMLIGTQHKPRKAIRKLVERGLVEEVPGLFPGFPQGYVAAE